jgi:hypothetical protein
MDLYAEVKNAFHQVQEQEFEIQRQADEAGINVMQMRYTDGSMAMAPVLLAKAQLLPVLYELEAKKEMDEKLERIKQRFLEKFGPIEKDES